MLWLYWEYWTIVLEIVDTRTVGVWACRLDSFGAWSLGGGFAGPGFGSAEASRAFEDLAIAAYLADSPKVDPVVP